MKTKAGQKEFREFYNSTIFTNIYKKNAWGGLRGQFYSGAGSHNPFVHGYSKVLSDFILAHNIHDIVEIGCGDFNVSSAILSALDAVNKDYRYTGYDVVKPLIARNKSLFGSTQINFVYKDACVGNIKSGDLLIIRQVLQHLNNKSISQILAKFPSYKYIIFTEHQISEKHDSFIIPNKDHLTGKETRLAKRSGVYLDKAPFHCTIEKKMFSILEWVYGFESYINTYLINNTVEKPIIG